MNEIEILKKRSDINVGFSKKRIVTKLMQSQNKSPVYIVGPVDHIVSKVFAWSTLYFFLLALSEAICSCVMRHLMVVKNNEIQDLDEWSLALVIRHSIYV